jgi:hypothetical protein
VCIKATFSDCSAVTALWSRIATFHDLGRNHEHQGLQVQWLGRCIPLETLGGVATPNMV